MPPANSETPIDVVIPVWNDAEALASAIPFLLREWPPGSIWVVDGGSSDGSAEIARSYGVRLLRSTAPSRACQMNAGAAASAGEAILFLHADTRLPPGARGLIREAVSSGAAGGAFARRFNLGSRFLRLTCRAAGWRGKWFGAFLGDQAIFATRRAFQEVGGFPDQPLFEDFEFSRQLSKVGRTVLLRKPVVSSGRRFDEKGPFRQTMADILLTLRYLRRGATIFLENGEEKSITARENPKAEPGCNTAARAPHSGRE